MVAVGACDGGFGSKGVCSVDGVNDVGGGDRGASPGVSVAGVVVVIVLVYVVLVVIVLVVMVVVDEVVVVVVIFVMLAVVVMLLVLAVVVETVGHVVSFSWPHLDPADSQS